MKILKLFFSFFFKFEPTEETKELTKLQIKPTNESLLCKATTTDFDLNFDIIKIESEKTDLKTIFKNDNLSINITQEQKDSDDDDDDDDDDEFVAYDTSNDVPLIKTKQPAFLRDCLDTLIYSEDGEKVEASMYAIDGLCKNYHFELEEICVELLKILLHKSNQYSIDNFDELRMNSMITITVHYPKQSAQYLTSQFYEAGFSLTQRTNILHVITISLEQN
jgi:telomere length regulation protein